MTDQQFAELCRLIKRCRPWTRARPPWFLFQMWLRRRPMNHEFLVSPIADYLLSAGVSNEALLRIDWPDWVMEFKRRYPSMVPSLLERYATVRDCLRALDSMRGWTPRLQHGKQP